MKATCPHCETTYRIDPSKVPASGVFARCSRCGGVFEISTRQAPVEAASTPSTAASAVTEVDSGQHEATAQQPTIPDVDPAPVTAPAATSAGDTDWQSVAVSGPPEDLDLDDESPAPLPELVSHRFEPPSTPSLEAAEATGSVQSADTIETVEVEGHSGSLPELTASRTALPQEPPVAPAERSAPSAAAPAVRPASPPPPSPIFGKPDPHGKARRLARALVSDIAVYNPERRDRGRADGTLRQEFRDEIRKSWEEYVGQVGESTARGTPYFREALNEILAGGQQVF